MFVSYLISLNLISLKPKTSKRILVVFKANNISPATNVLHSPSKPAAEIVWSPLDFSYNLTRTIQKEAIIFVTGNCAVEVFVYSVWLYTHYTVCV